MPRYVVREIRVDIRSVVLRVKVVLLVAT